MIANLAAWWRSRTSRERLLVGGAAIFVFAIVLPFLAWQGASSFRARAAAELAGAREIEANVARIAMGAGAAAQAPASDGTLRGKAMAAADATGLVVTTIAPAGPERLRISFGPADSLAVYRWIDAMSASGAHVASTTITRSGQSDAVISEFEVAERP
jgi:type II secretory pathway component PulM